MPYPRKRFACHVVTRALCGLVGGSMLGLGLGQGQAQSVTIGQDGTPPETHVVTQGETLWGLSQRYYATPYEWPRLWSYNPEITNPHWIYPGHVLKLRGDANAAVAAAGEPPAPGAAAPGAQARVLKRTSGGASSADAMATGTVTLGEHVYLDAEALSRAGSIVGSSEDHMLLFPSDEVYLQFEKDVVPEIGRELSVFFRQHRDELSPVASKLRTYNRSGGEVVRVLGALKVTDYDDKRRIAKARITEAMDPIERGFEVTDVPLRMEKVPVRSNAVGVKAQIVAAPRPLGTLGQNQVVFISAGSKQGVEVGNRFVVVRQGDAWRDNLTLREHLTGAERPATNPLKGEDYPEEVVAEARVIYVRPESCTALITEALLEVSPGDRVEMREGY